MRRRALNIFRLGAKELHSLRRDPVLIFLIVYTFTFAVYTVASNAQSEVRNAAVAVVDEDRSPLSRRIRDAILMPYFQKPAEIGVGEIDRAMDTGRYTFVLDIPPDFQADVQAGRRTAIQLNVDATAMSQAGNGARYLGAIITDEIRSFLRADGAVPPDPVDLIVRAKFNPNLHSSWFMSVMQIVNNLTLLAIVLAGAALIREREHGTVEHLLVMPIRPSDIMLAKVWANGLVVVVAATLSLWLVVKGLLDVPIPGSIALFVFGSVVYLFSVTGLGIFLATLARSMPQFGLLSIPVFLLLNFMSGSITPLESMPEVLQALMHLSPTTHFVSFAQAVLFRGASLDLVWQPFLVVAAIGAAFFVGALARFRATLSAVAQ